MLASASSHLKKLMCSVQESSSMRAAVVMIMSMLTSSHLKQFETTARSNPFVLVLQFIQTTVCSFSFSTHILYSQCLSAKQLHITRIKVDIHNPFVWVLQFIQTTVCSFRAFHSQDHSMYTTQTLLTFITNSGVFQL